MFFETKLLVDVKLPASQSSEIVKFGKNSQFTLLRKHIGALSCMLCIEELIGDFKILKITEITRAAIIHRREVPYDENRKSFFHYYDRDNSERTFYEFEIIANIEYEVVNNVKDIYHLYFPSERLKMLGEYQLEKRDFVLPKYQDLKFTCYFKKQEKRIVEVHIVNPYNLKIEGKKGDFKYETNDKNDINFKLSFIFDPSTVYDNEKVESIESRPESAMHSI